MDKPSYKFWTKGDKYHDVFMRNMKAARQLKKRFEPALILAAVRSEHFEKIYHIGLKAHNPAGWKYNPVAIEAVKRYHKEREDSLKLSKESNKEAVIEEPESKTLKHRNRQYANKKSSINKLRKL